MPRSGGGRRGRGGALVLAGTVLLGAGCGSPDDGGPGGAAASPAATAAAVTTAPATSPGGAPEPAPGPCDALSGAEVAAALGGSGAGGRQLQAHGCVYPSTGGPPRLLVSVATAGGSAEALTAAAGLERVDGLGEWAGWSPATKTLTVLSHDRLLGLTYLGQDLDEDAARSVLHGLARRALDRW